MAVTPGVRSSRGDRLPKRLRHRRMEPGRTPPPPLWPRAPSRRNVNGRCHDTSISLGEQQVSVIKRQVLVITRRQTQPMSSVRGRAPYWQEMHEVSRNEINRTHPPSPVPPSTYTHTQASAVVFRSVKDETRAATCVLQNQSPFQHS